MKFSAGILFLPKTEFGTNYKPIMVAMNIKIGAMVTSQPYRIGGCHPQGGELEILSD